MDAFLDQRRSRRAGTVRSTPAPLFFADVKARALKKPEVRAGFARARAMRIGAVAVQEVRAAKKLSQSDIANAMGKPQPLVARIESARANTTVETLYEIAKAKGTKLVIKFARGTKR